MLTITDLGEGFCPPQRGCYPKVFKPAIVIRSQILSNVCFDKLSTNGISTDIPHPLHQNYELI